MRDLLRRGFFKNLSISKKLAAVFVFVLFLMVVSGTVAMYNAGQIARVTEVLYLNSFKRVETLSTLENELLSSRQEIFLHTIITEQSTKKFLTISLGEHKKKMESLTEQYEKMGIQEGNKNLLDTLRANLAGYWHVHGKILNFSAIGDRNTALKMIQTSGDKSFTSTIEALKSLITQERRTAFEFYNRSDYFASVIKVMTFVFSLSAIIVLTGLWMALKRSIVTPILAIMESSKKIAGGDFAGRVPVMSDDEIGVLATEFNKMTESLQEYYATLENRVRERTEELRLANVELLDKKQELELANIELHGANRMKSQFLANVSHELRTPLNSIIGFSELLGERAFGDLNDKQGQYVEFIHSSGEHLLRLINNILDLSKIEAGKMELVGEVFPITEVIGEVLGIMRPLAHEKNVTIDVKKVPASPKLRADKAKFKQIMLNLLSNAVKFNVKGGKVDIDWTITEEPDGMKLNRVVVFTIKDTGIGVNDKEMEKLFMEFGQLDSSFTREYEGTGLGLALTKRLVELHKGEIWAESRPGSGSVFYVKLPQGTEEIDLPEVSDRVLSSAGAKERPLIIIASESPDINHLLEIYLAGGVYEVETAPDGFELLEKVRSEKPFAVIMGVAIPKKDGWEVLKELKADPATTHIPVIIVSSTDNRELGHALGAVECMDKPVDRVMLLKILNRLSAPVKKLKPLSRVLLVGDELEKLEQAVKVLEKKGLLVFVAGADKKSLDIVSSCKPDCIVAMMKGRRKGFFDFIEETKKIEGPRNTPIIVFAPGTVTEEDRKRLNGPNVRIVVQKDGPLCDNIVNTVKGIEAV